MESQENEAPLSGAAGPNQVPPVPVPEDQRADQGLYEPIPPPFNNDEEEDRVIDDTLENLLADYERKTKRAKELELNNPHFHPYQLYFVSQEDDPLEQARLMRIFLNQIQFWETLQEQEHRRHESRRERSANIISTEGRGDDLMQQLVALNEESHRLVGQLRGIRGDRAV